MGRLRFKDSMNEQSKKVNKLVNELNKKYCWSNDKNLDKFYSLNKKTYNQTKEIYKEVNPSFIIQFGLILPSDLPFDKNEFSTYKVTEDGNRLGFSFHFDSLREKSFFYAGRKLRFRKSFDTYRTRCEVSVLMQSPIILYDGDSYNIENDMQTVKNAKHLKNADMEFLNSAGRVLKSQKYLFEIAINDLNEIMLNYAFLSDDEVVCSINRDNIEFASHFRGITVSSWETYNWMTVHNVSAYPRERKSNFIPEYLSQSLFIRPTENYFFEFKKNFQNARYLLSRGFTIESLIKMNTAIEVLVNQILALCWSAEEKNTLEEIIKKIDDISFKKRLNSELPKFLGGNWDVTNTDKIVGKWYTNSYDLRNKMVHGGYIPELNEVYDSMNCNYEFINYVINLMNKSKFDYLHDLNAIYKINIEKRKL